MDEQQRPLALRFAHDVKEMHVDAVDPRQELWISVQVLDGSRDIMALDPVTADATEYTG